MPDKRKPTRTRQCGYLTCLGFKLAKLREMHFNRVRRDQILGAGGGEYFLRCEMSSFGVALQGSWCPRQPGVLIELHDIVGCEGELITW